MVQQTHHAVTLGRALCLLVAMACVPLPALATEKRSSHELTAVEPRTPLATFELQDLDGQTHRLEALRGRVVVVNFWAVWCQPCRKEMPALERLRARLADQPFAVVTVAQGETAESVRKYLATLKPAPRFLGLLDPDWAATQACGVRGLPASYVLDKQGRIAYLAVGAREFDHPEIVRVIEALLRE